jgi:hypothetical protein
MSAAAILVQPVLGALAGWMSWRAGEALGTPFFLFWSLGAAVAALGLAAIFLKFRDRIAAFCVGRPGWALAASLSAFLTAGAAAVGACILFWGFFRPGRGGSLARMLRVGVLVLFLGGTAVMAVVDGLRCARSLRD